MLHEMAALFNGNGCYEEYSPKVERLELQIRDTDKKIRSLRGKLADRQREVEGAIVVKGGRDMKRGSEASFHEVEEQIEDKLALIFDSKELEVIKDAIQYFFEVGKTYNEFSIFFNDTYVISLKINGGAAFF